MKADFIFLESSIFISRISARSLLNARETGMRIVHSWGTFGPAPHREGL
jgi:hypothetical protein